VPLERTVTRKAEFISFNAVECAVPVVRSYLISISNNGVNDSRALLFIPFDSACSTCNIFNTSCTKIVRSFPLVSQQQPLPCVCLSVRPSGRLSVARRYCIGSSCLFAYRGFSRPGVF